MTPEEKNRLYALRKAGRSYTEIADEMGISKNTVKTYCRRTGLTPADEIGADAQVPKHTADKFCLYCGKPVVQIPGRKEKKFCSDICRNRWWNSHMDLVARKAMYEYTCPTCGNTFSAYGNRKRKYCSHDCYTIGLLLSTFQLVFQFPYRLILSLPRPALGQMPDPAHLRQ